MSDAGATRGAFCGRLLTYRTMPPASTTKTRGQSPAWSTPSETRSIGSASSTVVAGFNPVRSLRLRASAASPWKTITVRACPGKAPPCCKPAQARATSRHQEQPQKTNSATGWPGPPDFRPVCCSARSSCRRPSVSGSVKFAIVSPSLGIRAAAFCSPAF